MSSSFTTTSTSSTSGMTATDANDVWRRLEASNGEIRIRRWTPVRVLARDLDRRRLDARLLAREQVDDLRLEARALRPPQIHPHQHLRPVLRLGAAGAGVDRHDDVLLVLRAGEHRLELEGLERAPDLGEALLDLGVQALVARLDGHLPQHADVGRLAREVAEGPYRAGELGALLDERLGLPGVVPEARRRHLGVDRGQPRLLAGEVKDGPGGRRAASPRPARRA
jgi:hypothetical protein